MAWSGFGQMHLVWKKTGVQEPSGPVSGRMQPVRYHFPTFRLGSVVPQMSWIILQSQPGSVLVLADCVKVLAKRIRSGSKPVCKKHPARFWPMLPSRSGPDANRILYVYWDSRTYVAGTPRCSGRHKTHAEKAVRKERQTKNRRTERCKHTLLWIFKTLCVSYSHQI